MDRACFWFNGIHNQHTAHVGMSRKCNKRSFSTIHRRSCGKFIGIYMYMYIIIPVGLCLQLSWVHRRFLSYTVVRDQGINHLIPIPALFFIKRLLNKVWKRYLIASYHKMPSSRTLTKVYMRSTGKTNPTEGSAQVCVCVHVHVCWERGRERELTCVLAAAAAWAFWSFSQGSLFPALRYGLNIDSPDWLQLVSSPPLPDSFPLDLPSPADRIHATSLPVVAGSLSLTTWRPCCTRPASVRVGSSLREMRV